MKHGLILMDLAAVWPQYIEGVGNLSKILTMNEDYIDDSRSPRSLFRRLLDNEGLDLTKYQNARKLLSHSKQTLPIVFKNHTFMTYKARHARVKGDEAYGYARLDLIDRIEDQAGYGVVVLINNIRLDTVEKTDRVQCHRDEAAWFLFNEQNKGDVDRTWMVQQQLRWLKLQASECAITEPDKGMETACPSWKDTGAGTCPFAHMKPRGN